MSELNDDPDVHTSLINTSTISTINVLPYELIRSILEKIPNQLIWPNKLLYSISKEIFIDNLVNIWQDINYCTNDKNKCLDNNSSEIDIKYYKKILPKSLECFPKLQNITLCGCNLSTIPRILDPNTITNIDLSYSKIEHFDINLFPNIVTLQLVCCELNKFDGTIPKKLNLLNLHHNPILEINLKLKQEVESYLYFSHCLSLCKISLNTKNLIGIVNIYKVNCASLNKIQIIGLNHDNINM